jgi:hypothetical protein
MKAILCGRDVQRKNLLATPSLDAAGIAPLFGQEILAGVQNKSPEPSALTVHDGQQLALKKVRKECLGEVLGLRWSVSTPAHVRIDGTPIGPTEFFQGCA